MTRISDTFQKLQTRDEAALIPYITLGWPTMNRSIDLAEAICNAGADFIELGVPYSDPIADGPTIREAAWQALKQGTTLQACLDAVVELRERGVTTPILLMGYMNPFLTYGLKKFAKAARGAGVDGLIIPDMVPESADSFFSVIDVNGLDWITFVAPTTDPKRIQLIGQSGSGFIYCISLIGITGARNDLEMEVHNYVREMKAQLPLPVAVGFGISTPEHVASISQVADGVIIGSALMNAISSDTDSDGIAVIDEFIRACKKATHRTHEGGIQCNPH